jgi:hypothetical protein
LGNIGKILRHDEIKGSLDQVEKYMRRQFKLGMLVVYLIQRHSTSPESNAKGVYAAPHGDDYSYYVEEYARVAAVLPEGNLIIHTNTGAQYTLPAEEPMLRRAGWWERLMLRKNFPPCIEIADRKQPEDKILEGIALTSPTRVGWQ